MSSKRLDKLNLICYAGNTMGKAKYPTEHDKTQYMALKWLEGLGYKCGLEANVKINRRNYRVDVYGEQGDNKVVIECGHTPKQKLRKLKEYIAKLYIWPIGSGEPIVWDDNADIDVCQSCGRIKSHIDFKEFNLDEFIKYKIPTNVEFMGGYLSYDDIPVRTIIKKLRKDGIVQMRQNGLTYEEIGNTIGVSKERVRQLLPINMRGELKGHKKKEYKKDVYLRDLGEQLKNNQAIKIIAKDLVEAKNIRARWYSYFGNKAGTRRIKEGNTYFVYLWLKVVK